MEFLWLSRRRSSARNVPSGEERGETDVFEGFHLERPFGTEYAYEKSLLWIFHLVALLFVVGFNNNNSINTVSFSIYLAFYVIFIKKWQKTRDCNFQHRPPIMDGC